MAAMLVAKDIFDLYWTSRDWQPVAASLEK